jgi:hypothetical protein
MKTKAVGNVDLASWCFAYAPDPAQPHTWKLPIHHPSKQRELNLILAAVQRFSSVKIPDAARAEVWHRITRQAHKHNVIVPSVMPKPAPAQPKKHDAPHVNTYQQTAAQTAAEKEAKEIMADAELRAERFLESIGF